MRASVSERLSIALSKRDINQTKLVELTGLNKSAISSYLNGKYEPKSDAVELMAKALHVSPTWLAGFDVQMEEGVNVSKADDLTITIPFVNQKLSAGSGEFYLSDEDIEVKTINISAFMARGIDKNTLLAAEVRGDSMVNEKIYSGDIVIFSRGLIRQEGIYVINYAGDVMVKKLAFDALNNTVDIISGNENYPTRTVEVDNVVILGKVIGWIHRIEI